MTDLMAQTGRVFFLDGGMGTQLQAKGLQPGEVPELWIFICCRLYTGRIFSKYLSIGCI